MRFWLRELAGWLLVGLGLLVFYVCFSLLLTDRPYILEAGPLTLIGIFIFRGGIHLLKVAVAARICLHAQRESAARSQEAVRAPASVGSARGLLARERR
jgi:hypothetical protein